VNGLLHSRFSLLSTDQDITGHLKRAVVLSGHNRSDELHWLVVNVDIGSISVTDDLREALIDTVKLLASGSSTLHMELKLGKDSENVTMDVEASSYTFSVIMYPHFS
jgi:hypothetical protein